MKYLLYIASILIACIIPIQSFAIDAKVSSAYTQLLTKLEQKYSLDMQETILKDLHNRLESFSENTSKTTLISIVDDLQSLNNEKLYDIWLKNELSPVNQKVQELREISAFKALLTNRTLPSYVSDILSSNTRYIKTDDKRQFTENNEIKRIVYSSYIPVSQSNASRLKNKSGIIIYDQASGYRFIETYSFETKIPYSQLASRFEVYLTNNHKISTTQESIYAYNFLNFRFFQDKYGAYESDLNTSGFSYDTTLLYKREDG